MQMEKSQKLQKQEAEAHDGEEAAIHGDVLETILCHVPLIHLLPALHVSKSWNRAVSSSLRHFNRPKPWLIVHTQRSRTPYATAAHAYDPRSGIWLRIDQPAIRYASWLRSSHSNLLYMLSPSKFSFSFDPLHLTWRHVDPPLVWRTDPIVAMVDHHIIVAGGACDFEDDPLAVEIYDVKTGEWDRCESMPAILKDSAASTWLSVAANEKRMYVMEQISGVTYCFYPKSKVWHGPYVLRPNRNIYFSGIGTLGDRLIMVGLIGNSENVKSVKLWEVSGDGESLEFCRDVGTMPNALLKKLTGEGASVNSVGMILKGNSIIIYNPAELWEVVTCEIGNENDGNCRWGSIQNAVVSDRSKVAERVVFTCSYVELGDLRRALGTKDVSFSVV